jgi:hypothetical protein
MELNFTGLAAAAATFFGVWFGHVMVRRVEARTEKLALPAALLVVAGLACEAGAVVTGSGAGGSTALAAALGIVGITLLFDALELYRQEKRVRTGHAPANPGNPRHARILAAYPAATTIDWLDREPRGSVYSKKDLGQIAAEVKRGRI